MARLPRLIIPHLPHYVIQRSSNRQPVFQDSSDYTQFLAWLKTGAKMFKVAIHAYVLLPDQLHLLATPGDATGLGQDLPLRSAYGEGYSLSASFNLS